MTLVLLAALWREGSHVVIKVVKGSEVCGCIFKFGEPVWTY